MDFSIVGKPFGPFVFEYDWRRPALYALACGAGAGAGAGPDDLSLVLEPAPKVRPTFSDVISFGPVLETAIALKAELLMRLHVAQKTTFHRPLAPKARLETTCTIRQIYDQGASALVLFVTETRDEQGPLFDTEWHVVYRTYGKFGGPKPPDPALNEPPEGHAPDAVVEVKTPPTIGLLYRLVSEDWNPIHADPQVARRMGFPKTILHGVCTFGHAARAALITLAPGVSKDATSVEARFVKPVFPNDTIATEIWRTSDTEALFRSRVVERNEQVISAGRLVIQPK
jgi:3-hydroxyacyl-CoA dehydrogenase/3a,7a,12a-trihydroxy-5b-cholest-24-enoyl-CoA hydratase